MSKWTWQADGSSSFTSSASVSVDLLRILGTVRIACENLGSARAMAGIQVSGIRRAESDESGIVDNIDITQPLITIHAVVCPGGCSPLCCPRSTHACGSLTRSALERPCTLAMCRGGTMPLRHRHYCRFRTNSRLLIRRERRRKGMSYTNSSH